MGMVDGNGRGPSGGLPRRGSVLVLVGPDGTGKSSVADRLGARAAEGFTAVRRFHWRPMLLPRPADLRRGEPRDPSEPHSAPPHPRLVSTLLLLYYWLDFVVGHLLVFRPARRRGELVVLERGWSDMEVDPLRYRLGTPPAWIRAVGRLVPRPDLRIVLDGRPEVVHARKPELSVDELARQRARWREIVAGDPRSVVVDASAPLDEVVERIESRLRGTVAAAGWVALPRPGRARVWVPRAPRRAAAEGLTLYQPSARTAIGATGLARSALRLGAARLLPATHGGPREARERLGPHLPHGGTYALLRTNHHGRFAARLLDARGRPVAHAKLVTSEGDPRPLAAEARALEHLAPGLRGAVRAPRLLDWDGAVLLTEALTPGRRRAPSVLPEPVAAALGALWATTGGTAHGDCAPWNLLRTDDGWVLVDWEHTTGAMPPFHDVLHFVVQAHAHLGAPTVADILDGVVRGRGPVGAALAAYATAAELEREAGAERLRRYLTEPNPALRPTADGTVEGGARRAALLDALP